MTDLPGLSAGVYQHYKGKYYQVLGYAQHTETNEIFVCYIPLYIDGEDGKPLTGPRIRVTPISRFFSVLESGVWSQRKTPRFTYRGPEVDPPAGK
jgi:hypothetical protein